MVISRFIMANSGYELTMVNNGKLSDSHHWILGLISELIFVDGQEWLILSQRQALGCMHFRCGRGGEHQGKRITASRCRLIACTHFLFPVYERGTGLADVDKATRICGWSTNNGWSNNWWCHKLWVKSTPDDNWATIQSTTPRLSNVECWTTDFLGWKGKCWIC